ncbi:MAG: M20/M25/M40 family metallo-hydrolase [Hyphomonadaceae bacterium]
MTAPVRSLTAAFLLWLSACATPGQPAPPFATSQQLHDRVGAFAQPTQDGRLAALKAQLDAAGLAYVVEPFDGKRTSAKGFNVVVSTGSAGAREILLTAHYDAVVLPGGKLVDGVVDNAASVVAMIEATRRVAGRTKHPVRLLVTDEEELGLVGAKAWIAAHGVGNLAAVINGDVNADGETLMYGLNNGAQSGFLNRAVGELCVARAMACLDFPEYPPSDEVAFIDAGAPAISLGHQPKAEAEKLRAFMLNPPKTRPDMATVPKVLAVIHTPNDKLANVEAATLAQTADFVTALVMKLDAELH